WQPLGDSVSFIACAKPGRNALDMHIAFYVGRLIGERQSAGTQRGTRFVVVSKDTDYDPLLIHIREVLGCTATRVTTIKAALSGVEHASPRATGRRPAASPAPAPRPAKSATAKTAPAAKAPPAAKTARKAVKKTAAKKAAKTPAAPRAAAAVKKVVVAPPAPDAKQKVIDSLRRMGEKLPNKRKGLEHHIESHLGRKLPPGAVPDVIAALERDGVLTFNDKKVEYRLPKERK
ncbi:MAG: PIN domain-containing protein, partial [Burkholderiaceae bacterium]